MNMMERKNGNKREANKEILKKIKEMKSMAKSRRKKKRRRAIEVGLNKDQER